MPYSLFVPNKLQKELNKLRRRDLATHRQLYRKIGQLLINPRIADPMRSYLKGIWHVHIGPFVLEYTINEEIRQVALKSFEHHDYSY
ncbi:MAG: hypothetical protein KGH65_00595 [Candidatus Micrarchaeota archaeon]|nr:hypothetical protein [Candidatus Micrarchaeota archaeon]